MHYIKRRKFFFIFFMACICLGQTAFLNEQLYPAVTPEKCDIRTQLIFKNLCTKIVNVFMNNI